MTRSAQTTEELEAFNIFLDVSGQPIDRSSVQPKSPPAPDIECRYSNGQSVAFELVELLDREFKRTFELQQSKTRAFYEHLDKLPLAEQQRFSAAFHNADILVNFRDDCPQNKIKALVPSVFKELLLLPAGFEDLIDTFQDKTLAKAVESISIMRGGFRGPLFNAQAIGWVGDPCVETVQNKLQKTYATSAPIELIAYIDTNPMFPENVWKPTLDQFVDGLTSLTPFRKLWVVDLRKKAIAYEKGG